MAMEKYLEKYPPVLTVAQVAEILGCCEKNVRKLIASGELIAIRVGRLIKVPKDRLIDFLNAA